MIYPIGEKPILQEPYFSFYSIFKEQPWEVMIAIGYSFRDELINTAIVERLNEGLAKKPRVKLIVVNPTAQDVIKNLGQVITPLDQSVIRIDAPLEDNEDLFEMISCALDCSGWNDYQERRSVTGKR
jgi:hypothetical protein